MRILIEKPTKRVKGLTCQMDGNVNVSRKCKPVVVSGQC
jgi:hypothetical protein